MFHRIWLAFALTNLSPQIRCLQMSSSSAETAEAQLHSIVFSTAPDETVARTIGRGLVTNKLAACVNIIPRIVSIYEWEGQMNEDSEVLMMIKTRTSRVAELTEFIRRNHPYSVCEVISTKIDNGNLPYLQWISSSVPEPPSEKTDL